MSYTLTNRNSSIYTPHVLCAGNCGDINLVRLGSERTISKSLKPFSLDHQTKARAREMNANTLSLLLQTLVNCESKRCVCMRRTSPADCWSWYTDTKGTTGPQHWYSVAALCKSQERYSRGTETSLILLNIWLLFHVQGCILEWFSCHAFYRGYCRKYRYP